MPGPMNGTPNVPVPRNEPVLGYAPGSPERKALQAELARMSGTTIEIPARIGGRSFEQLRSQQCDGRIEHLVVGRQSLRVASREGSYGGQRAGGVRSRGERAPVRQRQEVLQGPLEHFQSVFDQAQVLYDLGIQQADGVARGGVAKAGVEFLGDGSAAEDRTALEDAHGEARPGEITGAGEAVMAPADYHHIEPGFRA